MSNQGEFVIAVQINSHWDIRHRGLPKYVERRMPRAHTHWLRRLEPCPISVTIGFPMCIDHFTLAPEDRHGNAEVADLHLICDPNSEDYGDVMPEFHRSVWGAVIVVRKDGQDLVVDQMHLTICYTSYLKDCLNLMAERGRGPEILDLPKLGDMNEDWIENHQLYYNRAHFT